MTPYCFVLQKDGARIEELGTMALPSDGEALAFGAGIAEDLAGAQHQQDGAAIAVIKGSRVLRNIPLT